MRIITVHRDLVHAMSDEVWEEVEREIEGEQYKAVVAAYREISQQLQKQVT